MKKLSLAPILAAVASTVALVGQAHAELPTGVATSVTAAQADGVALLGILAAAGAAVFLIGKVLRRFGVML